MDESLPAFMMSLLLAWRERGDDRVISALIEVLGGLTTTGDLLNPEGVDEDYLANGTYEIEVAGRRTPCTLHLRPLYDPAMARVRS